MTDLDIKKIILACENAQNREREHAKTMKEIRPNECERIEREKEIFFLGVQTAYFEILRQFNKI